MVLKTENPNQLTSEQAKKVRSLIRAECCNCDGGNCVLLDDGEYHKCPQLTNSTVNCSWFIEAVLPLNPALEAELRHTGEDVTKKCATCGKAFVPRSNRATYCPKCAKLMLRRSQAEYARQKRSKSKIRAY